MSEMVQKYHNGFEFFLKNSYYQNVCMGYKNVTESKFEVLCFILLSSMN
jgi:hypothetical protein